MLFSTCHRDRQHHARRHQNRAAPFRAHNLGVPAWSRSPTHNHSLSTVCVLTSRPSPPPRCQPLCHSSAQLQPPHPRKRQLCRAYLSPPLHFAPWPPCGLLSTSPRLSSPSHPGSVQQRSGCTEQHLREGAAAGSDPWRSRYTRVYVVLVAPSALYPAWPLG